MSRAPPPAAVSATAVADTAGAVVSDVAGPVIAVVMVPAKVMYL